jgi:Holliday junction resolvasome RuvABC endonuclease subunit
MVAIIETFCIEHGINYTAFSASEIKKFATGKGNANKDAMVKAAHDKYGYTGKDDNIADALHILHLAMKTFQ